MRVDQRSPVVTALSIISHLLRRYSNSPLRTSEEWLFRLREQLGEDALILAGGPDDKPQFLQPVLLGLGEVFTEVGGLISYGPDVIDEFRRAVWYADRILKGEKPSELPVQAPTKFTLVINLKPPRRSASMW